MAGQVGVASSARLRFSVVPRSVPIEIERPNAFKASDDDPDSMLVELKGWPSGARCPVHIAIAVESAYDAYRMAMRDENDRRRAAGEIITDTVTDPETGEQSDRQRYVGPTHIVSQIMADLRRDLLCAVVEGLEEHEASMLVENEGPWEEILVSLGWWTKRTEATEEASEEGDPEATGEGATESSSPA